MDVYEITGNVSPERLHFFTDYFGPFAGEQQHFTNLLFSGRKG